MQNSADAAWEKVLSHAVPLRNLASSVQAVKKQQGEMDIDLMPVREGIEELRTRARSKIGNTFEALMKHWEQTGDPQAAEATIGQVSILMYPKLSVGEKIAIRRDVSRSSDSHPMDLKLSRAILGLSTPHASQLSPELTQDELLQWVAMRVQQQFSSVM